MSKVTVLLLGADGQIGDAIAQELAEHPLFQVVALNSAEVRAEALAEQITSNAPDFVVNALTADCLEQGLNLEDEHSVVIDSLIQSCRNISTIHLSTSQVLGYRADVLYDETADIAPESISGKQQLSIERKLQKNLERLIVLRTCWVFGGIGNSVFNQFLTRLEDGGTIELDNGMVGAPTAASDVARVVVAVIRQLNYGADCWGTYHYSSSDVSSIGEFVQTLVTLARQHNKGGSAKPELGRVGRAE